MTARLPFLILLALPACVFAHSADDNGNGTQVDVALSASWRSDSAVPANTLWQIPGVLTGGHALPVDKGLSLDEASLTLSHQRPDGIYGLLKAETHGSEDSLSLEHAYLGFQPRDGVATWLRLEAGRMNGEFSPANREHASTRLFSETPLVMDAFLGRHFVDDGLRLVARLPGQLSLGVESWRGRAFPATSGQGSTDVFARWHFATESWQLEAGAFGMKSEAEKRIDERYSAGHSHGGTTLTGPDVNFIGETLLYGVSGRLTWWMADEARLSLQGEWLQQEPDGTVQNSSVTRQAFFTATQTGGYLQLEGRWKQHELGLRHESVVVDNQLTGSGAAVLAQDIPHLVNNGFNPERLTLAYAYAFRPGVKARLEWVRDESSATSQDRVAVGLVWRETLWQSGD